MKKTIIATIVAMLVSAPVYADLTSDLSFGTGNYNGWTTGPTSGTQTGNYTGNGIGAATVTGGTVSCCGPNTWVVTPYTGSYMVSLQPNGGPNFNTLTSALGLSSASVTALNTEINAQGSGQITSGTWVTKSLTFNQPATFKMAWNYISTDYVPFNDGSLTSLVNTTNATDLGKINGITKEYLLLGATNPGTGNYSTNSYGSTGWQWVNYSITSSGTYKLGFAAFNQGDTALSPVLFVNDGLGTTTKNGTAFNPVAPNDPNMPTTNPDGTISGGGTTPSTPTVTGTSNVNGTPTYADTNGASLVINTSTVATNYLTRSYNNFTSTEVGRVTTTPVNIVTSYSDGTSTSATGTPITVSEKYYHNIDQTHNDVATGSSPIGDAVWVSNGIDNSSLVNTRTTPTSVQNSKTLTVSTSGVITANELYTITTPTRFTYARTTTTVTSDEFAPTSTYTNTSSTATTTSTVTGDYDVVTNDSVGRSASYAVSVGLRTDQISTISQLQSMINRNTEFGKTFTYKYYDHSRDGYRGNSTVLGIGHAKDIDGGMNLGLGINKIDTRLSGNASSAGSETVQLGATLSKKDVEGFDLSGTVQHSMTDYNVSATPIVNIVSSGDSRLLATQAFNNNLPNVVGKTRGQDTSVSVKAIGPGVGPDEMIRPIIGATYGQRSANGYMANIDVLPGVTVSNRVNNLNQDYGYATAGAVVKKGIFNATALYHTDGVKQLGVGLSQEKDNLTFNIRADRLETNQGGSNVYGANLIYKF